MRSIPNQRSLFDRSRDYLERARNKYAEVVRRGINNATSDEARLIILRVCAAKARERGLWKSLTRKTDGWNRHACYALLARMHKRDAATDEQFRGTWGKARWLDFHGWTACGEESTNFTSKAKSA